MKAVANYLTTVLIYSSAFVQVSEPLTLERAIQQALERNPGIQVAIAELNQVQTHLAGREVGFNPEFELAPGIGFTNASAIISQQFDISGLRSAQIRVAQWK